MKASSKLSGNVVKRLFDNNISAGLIEIEIVLNYLNEVKRILEDEQSKSS